MGLLTVAVAAAAVALTGVGATATLPSATLVSTIPASALTLGTQSVLSGKSFVSAETVRAFVLCACGAELPVTQPLMCSLHQSTTLALL
jgi:hypothetical protein